MLKYPIFNKWKIYIIIACNYNCGSKIINMMYFYGPIAMYFNFEDTILNNVSLNNHHLSANTI